MYEGEVIPLQAIKLLRNFVDSLGMFLKKFRRPWSICWRAGLRRKGGSTAHAPPSVSVRSNNVHSDRIYGRSPRSVNVFETSNNPSWPFRFESSSDHVVLTEAIVLCSAEPS